MEGRSTVVGADGRDALYAVESSLGVKASTSRPELPTCCSTTSQTPLPAMLLFLHEKEILMPRQRTIGVRLLPAGGRFQHVVADQPEQLVDLDIGCCDALDQRDGKGAVVALTVERGLAVFGRIGNERSGRHFDLAEPAVDRAHDCRGGATRCCRAVRF